MKNDNLYAMGVDVANSMNGDKAAIALGKGNILLRVDVFTCPDSNQLGKRDIYYLMREHAIRPERVGVDSVGVGAGTVNALIELGLRVQALGGAKAPIKKEGEEKFNNLRSQMYWQLREDLRNKLIGLPKDEELFAELITPTWSTRNGKIVIESKEEIKKRLGFSPNRADAVVYWNWVRQNVYSGKIYTRMTRKQKKINKMLAEFKGLYT